MLLSGRLDKVVPKGCTTIQASVGLPEPVLWKFLAQVANSPSRCSVRWLTFTVKCGAAADLVKGVVGDNLRLLRPAPLHGSTDSHLRLVVARADEGLVTRLQEVQVIKARLETTRKVCVCACA